MSETVTDAMERRLLEMAVTNEAIGDNTLLSSVLARLAQRAREVTDADFAAISTFDENDKLERFIYVGMDDVTAQRLGHPPTGRGLLGDLARRSTPLRLEHLADYSGFTGWPSGHPEMDAFLGVPIRAADRTIGSLYMTRLVGRPPFTADDEMAGAVLALQTAARIASSLARERTGRVLLLEERERIAHDLHDGTIQTLYALGLRFDAALRIAELPQVRGTLEDGITSVNQLIADLRQFITMLEAETPNTEPDLSRDLPFIVRQVVAPGIDTVVNIAAVALHELSPRETEDLLFFAREALSNAVRHGQPTKIAVDLRQSAYETALTIQDNGVGFDETNVRHGLGSVTMESRAEKLGGRFTLLGIPGMGTTVRVSIPRREPNEQ